MQEDLPEYLTVEEVATRLRLDISTIRKYIRQKKLIAYKFGREYRIYREDFLAFMAQHKTQ